MPNEQMDHARRKRARLTSDKGELLLKDLSKLSFRDTVPVEDNTFRRLVGLFLFEVGSVVDEFGDHVLRGNKSANRDGDNPARRGTLVILFKSSTISTRDS